MKGKLLGNIKLVIIFSLFIAACKKPDTGISVNINMDVTKYTQLVEFIDPATNAAPKNITIQLTGPDVDKVYEISGVKSFNVIKGIISFMIAPSAKITPSSPITYNIVASAPGYISVCRKITVTSTDYQSYIKIPMVNINALPAGASYSPISLHIVNGVLQNTVKISTPINATKADSCYLTFPAGMKFYDSLGNQITQTGTVSGRMVHFSNRDNSIRSYFPGGSLFNPGFIDNTQNSISSLFFTMGYTDIELNIGGTPIKKFDTSAILQPILTMYLNDTAINPKTGTYVKESDTLKVCSYQLESNKWSYDAKELIQSRGNKIFVSHKLVHLSSYNFGIDDGTYRCPTSDAIILTGDNKDIIANYFTNAFYQLNYYVVNFIPDDEKLIYRYVDYISCCDTFPITFKFAYFPGRSGTYEIKSLTGLSGSAHYGGNCSSVTVPMSVASEKSKVYVKIKGVCANNKNKVVSPSFYVYYNELGTSQTALLGYVNNGVIVTNVLEKGVTYNFYAIYGDKQYQVTRKIDSLVNTAVIDMTSTSFCQQ